MNAINYLNHSFVPHTNIGHMQQYRYCEKCLLKVYCIGSEMFSYIDKDKRTNLINNYPLTLTCEEVMIKNILE